MRLAHGFEKLGILGRFHGDLRVEHHVLRQRREAFHQLEALGAHRGELLEAALVVPPRRLREIVEGHRIEVVVGERDEPESHPAERHDFVDDRVDAALPRPLPVGLPHRAERAVLRTAADRLHRGPHVFVARHERPARRLEFAAFDLAAVVHRQRRVARAVFEHTGPDQITVTFDDRVCATKFGGLFRIQRGVNAAEHDVRAARARSLTDPIAVQRVPGVNADPYDVARLDARGIPRL